MPTRDWGREDPLGFGGFPSRGENHGHTVGHRNLPPRVRCPVKGNVIPYPFAYAPIAFENIPRAQPAIEYDRCDVAQQVSVGPFLRLLIPSWFAADSSITFDPEK